MASLLENVRRGLESAPATPQQIGAQAQVQELTRATTGKSVGSGTTPALSTQQQSMAAQQTQQQQRQLQQQQQEAAGQLGAAERQVDVQQRQAKLRLSEKEIQVREQAYQRLGNLLDEMAKGKDKLELGKLKAQTEQAGFLYRLNSEKYVTKLQIEGRKARLDNELQFKEALTRAIFKEERTLLQENLEFQSLIAATGRDYKEKLEMMSVEQAMELSRIDADVANTAAKYEAISTITSGVVRAGSSAASSYDWSGEGEQGTWSFSSLTGGT